MLRSFELNPRDEERAETDSTGFLTVEFDPDLAVRKQWGLYWASFGANYNWRGERERWCALVQVQTSALVYWPNSVTGPSRSKHLGAISLSRGKTRTFLQRVTLSSQPPYLLEKWNPFQIGWWVIIFHDKMIKLSSRACRIPLVSPATLVICLVSI